MNNNRHAVNVSGNGQMGSVGGVRKISGHGAKGQGVDKAGAIVRIGAALAEARFRGRQFMSEGIIEKASALSIRYDARSSSREGSATGGNGRIGGIGDPERADILDTATVLFMWEGYAIELDRIIEAAGVTPTTFWRHFGSRHDLVAAVLRRYALARATSLDAFIGHYRKPVERLKAVFLWHEHEFRRAGPDGCLLMNAVACFHDPEDSIRDIVANWKAHLQVLLGRLLAALPESISVPPDTGRLTRSLALLLDGASATAQLSGQAEPAMLAWESAQQLIGISSDSR